MTAFRRGSISLRLYPHLSLPAEEVVAELLLQARLAEQAGFDGLMVSEHHNAFAGYLPNPTQVSGWLLDATTGLWAAPCPLLLPLRPASLVVEEIAWLAARFPDRVGVGLAAGSLEADFAVMGLDKAEVIRGFADALAIAAGMLSGRDAGPLAADPAVQRCRQHPVPVLSAAMSPAAARRAARLGVGMLLDSLTTPSRCREVVDTYSDAGGSGPVVLIRRVWVGAPPTERQERQLDLYRSYADPAATQHWDDQQLASGDADEIAETIAAQAAQIGADALNLRIHSPGLPAADARRQIDALAGVVDRLHARWT